MIYNAFSVNLKTNEYFCLLTTNSLEKARNACSRDYAHLTESEKKHTMECIEGFNIKVESDSIEELVDALYDYRDEKGFDTYPDFYEEYTE